ncbi:hypothetical protein RA210_U280018 [Rubrivivax sp. A210]|nr:hypothetical protein RA210_U280018 [Rubrivivax sp. A210]
MALRLSEGLGVGAVDMLANPGIPCRKLLTHTNEPWPHLCQEYATFDGRVFGCVLGDFFLTDPCSWNHHATSHAVQMWAAKREFPGFKELSIVLDMFAHTRLLKQCFAGQPLRTWSVEYYKSHVLHGLCDLSTFAGDAGLTVDGTKNCQEASRSYRPTN